MFDRRMFLLGTVALGAAACVPSAGAATIAASGAAGMNPGPDGADRPLTLQVIQMRGTGAFDGADFFALQNPQAALGGDFIRVDQIAIAPGGNVSKVIGLDPSVTALGFVAGFRDPAGKTFRIKTAVSPTAKVGFQASVGPGGLTLSPA